MHPARVLFLGFLVAPLFVGCTDKADDTSSSEGDDADDGVTYYDDIEPILATHCTRCHADGGLGTGDFTEVETVESLADWMREAMEAERMPPPTSDPECRDYVGSDHLRMSDESKAQFVAWIDGGKVRGESRDASTIIDTRLSDADVVSGMSEPYTPTFEREDEPGNEYRCFIIDTSELEGRYITAMGPDVGSPELMHHITLNRVDKQQVGDEYLDPQGWDCIDEVQTFSSEEIFGGWAPGTLPVVYPEGSGIYVDENTVLLLSMHYVMNADDLEMSDQTRVLFRVADTVEDELDMFPLGVESFAIPPGAEDYAKSRSLPGNFIPNAKIVSVIPHMHQLGNAYDMRLIHADGAETCGVSGDFTFDNQINYQFIEPLEVKESDTLQFACRWDNPGTETIRYGERTDEEMCIFFTMFSGL